MKRTYQSRRCKTIQSNNENNENNENNGNNGNNFKYNQITHKYHRKSGRSHNLGNNRIVCKDDESDKESDKENIICRRSESLESTTSYLSLLSLKHEKQKKQIIINDELTLDDICNDEIDISEQYFDPESIWPSWVSNDMIQRKRKRNNKNDKSNIYGSPPSKKKKSKSKSPNNKSTKSNMIVYSTVRKNKRRSRRTSIETPIGSIRTQRIHRLTRKSNTDLLFDVLLRENNNFQLNKIKHELKIKNKKYKNKINFNDLNGLKCIGKIDNCEEKLYLYLLGLGANPLLLNRDGLSIIYIAIHYKNNYNIILEMINKCICIENGYDELNQTYIFAQHGTLSLLDIALRIGERQTIKLLLENKLMPTKHTINYKPKIKLIDFCKHHRLFSLANKVLKEQLFEAVENFDIDYIESIISHGIDINCKMDINKTCLYWLVQKPFDMYDQLDAKDQYHTIVMLLKHGANPNCLDSSKTPMLIYPLQRSGPWNIKLVDILLYYGTNLKSTVGHTSKSLYNYAKDNCVCMQIQNIITNYYNNNHSNDCVNINKKNNKKKKITTVQLKVTTNKELNSMIKTKNIVKKNYKRNRKSAKGQ